MRAAAAAQSEGIGQVTWLGWSGKQGLCMHSAKGGRMHQNHTYIEHMYFSLVYRLPEFMARISCLSSLATLIAVGISQLIADQFSSAATVTTTYIPVASWS